MGKYISLALALITTGKDDTSNHISVHEEAEATVDYWFQQIQLLFNF